jgi:hypothetical protein
MSIATNAGQFSFLDVIFRAVAYFEQGRKRRTQALQVLAQRKFSELEATHQLFMTLLGDLSGAARTAASQLAITDDVETVRKAFFDAVSAVEIARDKGVDSRLKTFSEAHVYAKRALDEKGILKKLDANVCEHLRQMMNAYVDYFQVDNVYLHELGRALTGTRDSIIGRFIATNKFDFTKVDVEKAVADIEILTETAIATSRRRWLEFAKRYHEFTFCLQENDLLS